MFKQRKLLWISLLVAIAGVALWYCGGAAVQTIRYMRLSGETIPAQIEWSVEKVGRDHFSVMGDYRFTVNEKTYSGRTFPPDLSFRNEKGAIWAAAAAREMEWPLFYRPSNPAISSLDHTFPTKKVTYALLLVAILAYFLTLGFYLRRRMFHRG